MTFDDIIKLADAGNTDAMVAAIDEFVWKNNGALADDPVIETKIIEYLNKAVLSGNVDAMNQLAAMYAEGRVVEKDDEQAFLWYRMASDNGNALATSNLGFSYYYGKGVEQNYEEAFKCFSKAAAWDIGDAIVRLGDFYRYGYYVKQDYKTAIMLYGKAYHLGKEDLTDWGNQQVYSDVCRRLGEMYYYGDGFDQNLVASAEYISKAWYYYVLREQNGDSYSSSGYQKTKSLLKKLIDQL